MDMGVTCTFTNKPLLLYNKVENVYPAAAEHRKCNTTVYRIKNEGRMV